jgi:rhodanese-related sulfurtransferase
MLCGGAAGRRLFATFLPRYLGAIREERRHWITRRDNRRSASRPAQNVKSNLVAGDPVSERQTIGALLDTARSRLERLEPPAALRAQAEGALIVDTRCAELRRNDGVIPGSVHVPLSVLYWRLDPTSGYSDPELTDTARRIVLCCAHGYSSSMAAATLHELGFNRATDIVGGFEAWAASGLPVTRAPGRRPAGERRSS